MQNQTTAAGKWWSPLTADQKLVFIVASAAWALDCLDQQLFNLARMPALQALLTGDQLANIKTLGAYATAIFVLGWATGGMIFGSLGDKYGRAKILGITVMIYSLATGLSAFSTAFWDFALYRFITGVGVGGVFGLSVALIADSVSNETRPRALGAFQAFSAVGNISAGLIGIAIAVTPMIAQNTNYWKWLFIIGALPALLTAIIQVRLKEPQKWVEARAKAGKKAGSYGELFGHPTWRRHSLLGMILSCAGVVGLWGIGVFSTDMVGDIVTQSLKDAGVAADQIGPKRQFWMAVNLLLFNVGAFGGMYTFGRCAVAWNRKRTFAVFFTGALIVTVFVFQKLGTVFGATNDILWMAPLLGFFQLSVFAGYSIYLPELFPTRLRSTGTSFCYNVGRYLAATGPLTLGVLAKNLAAKAADPVAKIDAFRDAASWMALIFLIGLLVLPFLPETKNKPLPED